MSPRMNILKWIAIVLAVLASLVAFFILLVATYDWNNARPWINRRVSGMLGRPFAINGDLAVAWKPAPASVTGWRAWVPWPQVSAGDIVLANPDWIEGVPNMVKVRQTTFTVAPLPLLRKQLFVPELHIDAPRVHLQRSADGRNNWTFGQDRKQDDAVAWKYELQQLVIGKGSVRIVDAARKADVHAAIDTPPDSDGGIAWTLTGTLDGERVAGDGRAGKLLTLRDEGTHYPVQASLKVGKTAIRADGTLTNPRSLTALDLRLKISGVSLAQLYPLTGIALPDSPPFSTEGRLSGTLNRRGGDWRYQGFKGKIGSSDIAGTLEVLSREPRPLLRGKLESSVLHFADLAPLVGADSNIDKVRRGQAPVQPAGKALPVEKFRTERLSSIDADVEFSSRKIVRKKQLPIDDLKTRVVLKDGVLSLAPLNFGVAGGRLVSQIRLDSRGGDKLKAELKISARRFRLQELLPRLPNAHATLGEINGEAALTATGNSVAELLASSNGEVRTLVDRGTVSKLLLEAMGLNVGNVIITRLFGDRQVDVNCLAGDFKVTRGVMDTRTFVMDTDEAALYMDGSIDLAREKLDLTLRPDTKSPRIVTLRSPIHVGGTFKDPDIDLDKAALAARAGGAIVLGIAAPAAAALLPLVNLGKDRDNPCGRLLAQARQRPEAPPPGQSSARHAGRPSPGAAAQSSGNGARPGTAASGNGEARDAQPRR